MKPDQLNHLKLIDAHLDKLLALAAKRTTGEWKTEPGNEDEIWGGSEYVCDCFDNRQSNADFIAACAGNAEAGWVATKSMIMLIFGYEELSKTITTPFTLDIIQLAKNSILESILIAWPLTRVTP